jgi:protein-tyrosine-phosphatase
VLNKENPYKLTSQSIQMPSVLFVCTANRFRSPLAAAIFRKALEERNDASDSWIVGSAGTWTTPGQPVIPAVLDAARTLGIDLAKHRSAGVSAQLLSEYDLILVMQATQKEALQSEFFPLSEHIHLLSNVVEHGSYDIPDSSGSSQEVAEVSSELNELIRRGLERICVLATALHNTRNSMR